MPDTSLPNPPHSGLRHVAIIMDGNNRWARAHGLSGIRGHHAGVESVRTVIQRAVERELEAITLFAFSSENWKRPAQEVSALMELFVLVLRREVARLHKNNIRISIVGERSRLPHSLNRAIDRAERLTRGNTGLRLIVAANYGGRWDITGAARRLAERVEAGELSAADIDEERLDDEIRGNGVPDVDLCIRTSGEQRISNFLLWQLAYAEFYFSSLYWPDFGAEAFDEALDTFARRKRRFGMTDEQVEVQQGA
ncbi:undecaprenyl pyrophosphate synthetase [Kushneria sinocarnis]|uniref:Ditrans,polycis-undecaprenyl-diphosphate synthase ((2E,6E)-farnesyl-diphosphate specific) n=1 Tax=Kushneria sinocarnis TaxID=595502 RepID=A0A420WXM1_9GAMM|nr:polyprenyl diphosphate synthase [Kushneria sinocarnis]RKR04443.1 undecaprenyl pyrophosphate synthetase [Kushneria sinocarnis]